MKLFSSNKEENPWISVSALMFILMIVFIFISIVYIKNTRSEKQKIQSIVITYEQMQTELSLDLQKEFGKDLNAWNALIDTSNLSIRFENPEVLFEVGSTELNEHFKAILNDFFPRLLQILTESKYKDKIEQICIEGHTSSEWSGENSPRKAYFKNMELSQGRTRKVLEYLLSDIQDEGLFDWTKSYMTANGLSSSKPILNTSQQEDKESSRRVEFRVRTNAEEQIVEKLKGNIR